MARMARDDDGRPAPEEAHRDRRADRLCRAHAPAGLRGGRQVRGPAAAARQIHPDRHHHDDFPGLGADAVAGDQIGDAGVLRPRRSRSDHVVAGGADQRVLGPYRGDRAVGHGDGAVVVDAVRRRSRDRRRLALVCGLWRRHHDRPFGRGGGDRDHDRAVSNSSARAGRGWLRKSSPPSSAPAS